MRLALSNTPPKTLSNLLWLALAAALAAPASASAQVRRPLPVVQRIEPTLGPPGTAVTLHGRFFDPAQTVWLGDAQLEVTSRLPSRWEVTVPARASTGTLEIRTARGNVRGPHFRVMPAAPAPVLSGVAPAAGPPGTTVTLRGENFSPRPTENVVRLGERLVVVQRATPNEITVAVPAEAITARFTVRVQGAGEVSSAADFTVTQGTTITSFEPAIGPARTRVTLHGTELPTSRRRARVYLGDARARVLSASETELVVEVPRRGARTGRWLVDVRGGPRAQSATDFEVRSPPVVRSLQPSRGAAGARVVITGANFGDDVRRVSARIGETALRVREVADARIVVEVPEGATTGPIEVVVPGLEPAHSAPFEVTAPLSIAHFTPGAGAAGTEVTVSGAGFSPTVADNTVRVGEVSAEVLAATATELRIRVPEGPSGPIRVAVAGSGEARTPAPFVVRVPPTIASFSPERVAPGGQVTITGANFGRRRGLVEVRVGDARCSVVNANDTTLLVTVPAAATTGPITVRLRLQGSATSARPLVVSE